jgi:hypothetical protein
VAEKQRLLASETGLKNNSLLQSFVIHLSLILQIQGWQSFIGVESFPISFATFTKKLLKTFDISDWSFKSLSFSFKIMSVSKLHPLLVKKGFIVGQKSLFFGPRL